MIEIALSIGQEDYYEYAFPESVVRKAIEANQLAPEVSTPAQQVRKPRVIEVQEGTTEESLRGVTTSWTIEPHEPKTKVLPRDNRSFRVPAGALENYMQERYGRSMPETALPPRGTVFVAAPPRPVNLANRVF